MKRVQMALGAGGLAVAGVVAVFAGGAPPAGAAGGVKVTLSPFSTCGIDVNAAWTHPKTGQTSISFTLDDLTTGHSISTGNNLSSTDTSSDALINNQCGGPDNFQATVVISGAKGNTLATSRVTSLEGTF